MVELAVGIVEDGFTAIDGLDRPLQYFRVAVGARHVLVVSTDTVDESVLAPHFPAHAVALVREEREGWARVSCGRHDESIAAAVAIVKASAGWDESSPIEIEIGAHHFDVMTEHATAWIARVTRTST